MLVRVLVLCLCFWLVLDHMEISNATELWLTTRLRSTLWLPPRLDVIEQSAVCGI